MKKAVYCFSLVVLMLLTTACGGSITTNTTSKIDSGTITCTKNSTNEDGYDVSDTMKVTYKDSKVTKVEETNIEEKEDSDTADLTVSFGQIFATVLNEINGFEVSYTKESDTKVKYVISVDYTQLDMDKLKEAFGSDFDEDSFYSDIDITIDEFKSNNLSDYTCE